MLTANNQCQKKFVNDIAVHSCDEKVIFTRVNDNIQNERAPLHISITNTESMYFAEKIPEHLDYINTAEFSLCDGVGSVVAGTFQGKNIKRFHGPDFMLKACEYGQDYGWRHFFYGGKEGVADILVGKLKKKYPNIQIAGTFCPPFRELSPDEEKHIIQYIQASKADVIWVGLGLLKQEKWINKYQKELNVPWGVGVGAAFDFHSGAVKRAPEFYRIIGFEWLYRLLREPRMLRRNFNSLVFMFNAMARGNKFKLIKREK